MKTIESTVLNQQSYDIFATTHEPIMIEKLGFFISLDEVKQATSAHINKGILKGLEDVKNGRVTEYNSKFIDDFDKELDQRLSSK